MNLRISNPLAGEGSRQSHMRLWVGVLAVGFAVIFVVRPLVNLGPWVSAIFLCLLMLVYGWITHQNEHVSPDTKGDGIYYLGLLFTFAALVAVLARFARALPEDDLTLPHRQLWYRTAHHNIRSCRACVVRHGARVGGGYCR